MLFYNMTEAAFKFQMMWITFLLAAVAVPERVADPVPQHRSIRQGERHQATPEASIRSGEPSEIAHDIIERSICQLSGHSL